MSAACSSPIDCASLVFTLPIVGNRVSTKRHFFIAILLGWEGAKRYLQQGNIILSIEKYKARCAKTPHTLIRSPVRRPPAVLAGGKKFWAASREVCRDAVRPLLSQVPQDEIPAVLK